MKWILLLVSICALIKHGVSLDIEDFEENPVEILNNEDDVSQAKEKEISLDESDLKHIAQLMMKMYENEMDAGDNADMLGPNKHRYVPADYTDLSRRFVWQYPYKEIVSGHKKAKDEEIIPVKAHPELVMALAKESLKKRNQRPVRQFEEKEILRTGDYWNAIWQEDIKPKDMLRDRNKTSKRNLNTIKAKILPGTRLYELIVQLKLISPQLLYIINKDHK